MLKGSARATPADDVTIGGARIERTMRRRTNAKSDKDFEFLLGTVNTVKCWCSQHHFRIGNHTFGSCAQKRRLLGGAIRMRVSLWLRP